MNTTSNVTTNATVSTLMSLLNAEYNMNKVADYVHMKESRTIDSATLILAPTTQFVQ